MKKILVLIFIINCVSELQSQQFITPINFIETEANKEAVIKYIEKNVKETFRTIEQFVGSSVIEIAFFPRSPCLERDGCR